MSNDLKRAKKLGQDNRMFGRVYAECPYNDPTMRGAWQQGWREADSEMLDDTEAQPARYDGYHASERYGCAEHQIFGDAFLYGDCPGAW